MATPISPGVYSTLTDLSNYVGVVPGTIGFISGLTKQGPDNILTYLSSNTSLTSQFGQPNINTYGKNYGQAPYMAYNYLNESGSFYFMRCMPTDAAYSNLQINVTDVGNVPAIQVKYNNSLNTMDSIYTALNATDGTSVFPLCILYPVGRGDFYNSLGVRFTKYSNPLVSGLYILDIYQVQSNGSEVIVESFQVSFDPNSTDLSGDSTWIVYVLNTYSSILRALMNVSDGGDYTSGYYKTIKVYANNVGSVSVNLTPANISDDKQNFTQWAGYKVIAIDSWGNKIYGYLGNTPTNNGTEVNVYSNSGLTTLGWSGDTTSFNVNTVVTYQVKTFNLDISFAFTSNIPTAMKFGSDGGLVTSNGTLNTVTATQILADGYAGLLDDSVLDTENIYFSMVFDGGYPNDVKTQIATLAQVRDDCVAILDNGDNANVSAALTTRQNVNVFNDFHTALYEEYNQVYDIFTGQDIWVSPVYHMAYILPRNDNVAELWFAAAGFNRGSIDTIKQLRYNPKLGDRDQFYLAQLNPIVKFNEGYTVWGNLTSQTQSSKMQNLSVVRMYMFIKRALAQFCRAYIFEQNDAITWSKINGEIVSFLNDIQKRRGLNSFSVEVSATDYELKTKRCHSTIILNPDTPLEIIMNNFYIQ